MKRGPEYWRSGTNWISNIKDKIFYWSQDYFDRLNKVKRYFHPTEWAHPGFLDPIRIGELNPKIIKDNWKNIQLIFRPEKQWLFLDQKQNLPNYTSSLQTPLLSEDPMETSLSSLVPWAQTMDMNVDTIPEYKPQTAATLNLTMSLDERMRLLKMDIDPIPEYISPTGTIRNLTLTQDERLKIKGEKVLPRLQTLKKKSETEKSIIAIAREEAKRQSLQKIPSPIQTLSPLQTKTPQIPYVTTWKAPIIATPVTTQRSLQTTTNIPLWIEPDWNAPDVEDVYSPMTTHRSSPDQLILYHQWQYPSLPSQMQTQHSTQTTNIPLSAAPSVKNIYSPMSTQSLRTSLSPIITPNLPLVSPPIPVIVPTTSTLVLPDFKIPETIREDILTKEKDPMTILKTSDQIRFQRGKTKSPEIFHERQGKISRVSRRKGIRPWGILPSGEVRKKMPRQKKKAAKKK